MELLSVVRTIRLSQNQLNSIEPLKACTCLQELDLARNIISSMVGANRILPQIISLDLGHNRLSSTAGLEKLFTLEMLNLSHNAIVSIAEVGYLVSLPNLLSLFLEGNPIERSSTYRSDVQKLLTNEVTLDGIPWASQDVNDFAMEKVPRRLVDSSNSAILRKQRIPVGLKLASHVDAANCSPQFNNRVVVLLRSLLLACTAIVLVQGFVHLAWSRDAESERVLLILIGSVGAAGGLLYVVVSVVSWMAKLFKVPNPPDSTSAGAGEAQLGQEGSLRRMSRRLSVCLVDDTFVRRRKGATNGARRKDGHISLSILQSSLQTLSKSPEVREV